MFAAGHQLSVFNRQSTIQVGGRWNKTKQRIDDAFEGVMVGLVFNGLRVFDLTANRDPRTNSKGDVQQLSSILDRLNEHSLLDTMQQVNSIYFYNKDNMIPICQRKVIDFLERISICMELNALGCTRSKFYLDNLSTKVFNWTFFEQLTKPRTEL